MSSIEDLLTAYEKNTGSLLMKSDERQYLISVLRSIYDFSSVIGMQECFSKNFDQVVFCVKNSHVILDCLNPQSRYCPDMQKAIKLFVLIIALQNRCSAMDSVDQKKLASLIDIKDIETLIDNNLNRDRTLEGSLLFFLNILNEFVFKDKKEQYIEFKKEDFDINEILVTESALMAALGSFQLFRELSEKNISIKSSLKYFFKLYYIFYSDVYFCLSHDKFTDILKNFIIQHGSDSRQLKFFFEFVFRLINDLKSTDLLNAGSFYQVKLIHPFETIDHLYDVSFSFYDRIQKEKTDYTVNYDKYAKILKNLLYYAWIEANHTYLLSKSFDDSEVKTEDFKMFSSDLAQIMIDGYFETGLVPTTSALGYFVSQNETSASTVPVVNSFSESPLFSGAFDKIIDMVKKTNLIKNEAIWGVLDHDIVKTAASGFLKNMGKNVGTSVHANVVKRFVSLNFSQVSSWVLLFWKAFGHSHSLKDMALNGGDGNLSNQIADLIKKPAINMISKGIEKIPYGSLATSQNIGQIMDVVLNQVHAFVGGKKTVEDAPFTSGESVITDFALTSNTVDAKDAF